MKIEDIRNAIMQRDNICLWHQNLEEISEEVYDLGHVIFLDYPNPPKDAMIEILKALSIDEEIKNIKNERMYYLKEKLLENLPDEKIIIIVDNFDTVNKLSKPLFEFLMKIRNISLVVNCYDDYSENMYGLFKKFRNFLDPEDEKIDITYGFFLIVSIFAVLIYLSIGLALPFYTATIVLASIWFGTTIFKTLLYTTR